MADQLALLCNGWHQCIMMSLGGAAGNECVLHNS